MIHIYSKSSIITNSTIYFAQDYETKGHSSIERDLTSLCLEHKSNVDASDWTLVAIVPSLPIDPSQYPELFI